MSEEQAEQKPMNLYQKINAVMRDIEYLQKDDSVSTGKSSYRALSEEKVTTEVRRALIKYGLVILPVEIEHRREELRDSDAKLKGYLTITDGRYKIVDIDTGQSEIIVSSGSGSDTQDKGIGKSQTYMYKYLLLRTFAIPSGEDTDKVSSAELDEKHQQEIQKKEEAIMKQMLAKWKVLAGKEDGFDKWVEETKAKGATLQQMHELLATRLLNKAEEDKKNAK